MRSKLLLLSGVLATAGVIACGGGGGGDKIKNFTDLSPEEQAGVSSNVAIMFNSGNQQGAIANISDGLSGFVSSQSSQFSILSVSRGLSKMAKNLSVKQAATCSCDNAGGTCSLTGSSNGVYTFQVENCRMAGYTYNCTIVVDTSNAPTFTFTLKSGCEISSPTGAISVSNDLTWKYSFDDSLCVSQGGYIEDMRINGGPISMEKSGNIVSISYENLSFSTDVYCAEANVIYWSVNGSITYEDNFCANARVEINVKTDPNFYYDTSTDTCGGSMLINDGQVVVNANTDCSVEVLDSNGQPIPEPTQTCQW